MQFKLEVTQMQNLQSWQQLTGFEIVQGVQTDLALVPDKSHLGFEQEHLMTICQKFVDLLQTLGRQELSVLHLLATNSG